MSLVKRYDNNREFDNEKYFGESEDKMYMIWVILNLMN